MRPCPPEGLALLGCHPPSWVCPLRPQVLAIKRNDTGEWALPGGMVHAGDSGLATVKKSINKVSNFKDPATVYDLPEVAAWCVSEAGEGKDQIDSNASINKQVQSSLWMPLPEEARCVSNTVIMG